LDGRTKARHRIGRPLYGLYVFDEHTGNIIHNQVRSQDNLYIPPKYMVLRKTLLDPVWRAFSWNRGFWQDALIDVGGFVPFGCFFCAYFSVSGFSRPALSASLLGALVSLIIEVKQEFLPTRDSSMADVINNTLGSVIGAAVCRGCLARAIRQRADWIARVAD
jgi:glycopeptide antibiotics resistance protein